MQNNIQTKMSSVHLRSIFRTPANTFQSQAFQKPTPLTPNWNPKLETQAFQYQCLAVPSTTKPDDKILGDIFSANCMTYCVTPTFTCIAFS